MTEPIEPASTRAHAAVPFMNPLGEALVDEAIAELGLPDGARVVETGCGSAALLLRVLAAWPAAAVGVGVDVDPYALARAPRDEPRLALVEARAEDAELEPGSFDLVVNVAASHAHGGFPAALGALAQLARPGGGLVLYGEGYWAREPSPEFLEALGSGATADELPLGLDALAAAARDAGLEVVATRAGTQEGFDAYEEGLAAAAERYDDPDAVAYARRIRERRAVPDGARTLAFALLTLRRP